MIQEDYDHLRVIIVTVDQRTDPAETYAKQLDGISRKIVSVMGQDCKIDYEFTEEIIPIPSGKYRFTISKLT